MIWDGPIKTLHVNTFYTLVLGFVLTSAQAPTISLKPGQVIDRSVRVAPGHYRLASSGLDKPALTVKGDDLTIDLTGVTIEGGDPFGDPDRYSGVGILIDGGSRVTIRGGAVRGFKVGVRAKHAPGVHLTGLDVSYNWKPRLLSGIEQENQSDWLSFHDNEHDEWLRYGAAIYVSDSDDVEIDHSRAVQGMNGLMLVRSAHAKVWNNVFSWLSGVGVGMYRTTDSRVMHNKIDWCVRGYSHGFYNRGQDSAGVLMYEQSSRNIVAYNSITHGGDGVFLWAGQSTMDTGQGGSNDNTFYDNDVSSAVANGIEATFSRNIIANNRIEDCWHGIWGGYSFDSLIAGNTFIGNTEGIAIEHGQHNTISGNSFAGEDTSIRLWANTTQDPNWGYPKARDTRSRDYELIHNQFLGDKTALDIARTQSIRSISNDFTGVGTKLRQGSDVVDFSELVFMELVEPVVVRPEPIVSGMDALLPPLARRGRATINVDEWGPFDYLSPKLWPSGRPSERPLRLRVLGPEGQWTLRSIRGATASATAGRVPGELPISPTGKGADLFVELEYRGAVVTSPRGQIIPEGKPYRFSYALFDPAIDWTAKFWKFDAASDPLTSPAAFTALMSKPPARTESLERLNFSNARAFGDGWTDHIAVSADGTFDLSAGKYELSVTSDDGIRVWLDERLVIDRWNIHGPTEDHAALSGSRHRIRLQYFQNTGAAALMVQIKHAPSPTH